MIFEKKKSYLTKKNARFDFLCNFSRNIYHSKKN